MDTRRPFTAKLDGTCAECGASIRVGDTIATIRDRHPRQYLGWCCLETRLRILRTGRV